MAYIGQSIKNGTFSVLDTSGNTYNGSNTTFSLGTQVGSAAQLLVSHDGVIQKPGTDYTLATGGTQITFTTAPASGASIFIVEISGAVGGPMNRDINGDELILDVDGDTSITADTDDQIDVKVGGTDILNITNSSSDAVITQAVQDKDILFKGNDGGSAITALTLDMSAAGLAIFNAGAAIGGTGAANTLDDYEEGTFTPTVSANGSASSGASYSLQEGYYLKVGENVLVHARILLSAKGSGTGSCGIGSLPFAPRDNYSSVNYEYFGGTMYNNLQNMGSNIINAALVHVGSAMIGFAMSAAGGANNFALLDMANLTDTSDIRATIWYQTSS